ncbi:MAG: anhydro-N-acetylmuramic acid kinase [Gammaproteobacteria bacterium]
MGAYYIGLMSGTSMDGIDAALVELDDNHCQLIAHHTHPIPDELQQSLLSLIEPGDNELARMMDCDVQLGNLFAVAANALLTKSDINSSQVIAIGSHGQTLRHYPDSKNPSTLQIGDANIIAHETGIMTVADFRRRDMAAGGQGAPLVPAFHKVMFSTDKNDQVVVNIGGIANITLLPADSDKKVCGFDTGPGNCLMDELAQQHLKLAYDRDGEWGASGHVHPGLLERMLNEPYFARTAPKSTGREYFNHQWLTELLKSFPNLAAQDIQATLCELTAQTICDAIICSMPSAKRVLICGGGVHNTALMNRLDELLIEQQVASTEIDNIDPDWVEAMAFAWLAKQTLENKPGNLPEVTGARHPVVLGAIYPC